MHRTYELSQLWNWLPAFRAVAETEHLSTAAEHLHVSRSALSRSIRLLEDRLGAPLFIRNAGAFKLNTAGEALLRSLRKAMRLLDDGCRDATQGAHGRVSVGATNHWAARLMLPCVPQLRAQYPHLEVFIHSLPSSGCGLRLLRGELDLVITDEAFTEGGVVVESLITFTRSVYCGRTHPLFRTRKAQAATSHAFAVQGGDAATTLDGWPVECPREVGLRYFETSVGLSTCLLGGFLVVLPDFLASAYVTAGELKRVVAPVVSSCSLWVAHRDPIGVGPAPALKQLVDERCATIEAGRSL